MAYGSRTRQVIVEESNIIAKNMIHRWKSYERIALMVHADGLQKLNTIGVHWNEAQETVINGDEQHQNVTQDELKAWTTKH